MRATRGRYTARADQYGVSVTETHGRSPGSSTGAREIPSDPELVLEYWGGDAEMLAFDSMLKSAARRSHPRERARVAARFIRDYELDSLHISYPDGAELSADRCWLVLRGPHHGRLRRREVLIRLPTCELL